MLPPDDRPRVMSLCSGIGGLDLMTKSIGWRTVCYVEQNPYRQEVLLRRMEDGWLDAAPIYDDLCTIDGRAWCGAVDCIVGGFPCQPFSVAGRRQGKDDSRNLWPSVRRCIAQVRPKLVFLENVPGLVQSVGGREPYALTVLSQLARMGYVGSTCIVGARDAGASHRRDRWFCLAYPGQQSTRADGRGLDSGREDGSPEAGIRATEGHGLADGDHLLVDAQESGFARRQWAECTGWTEPDRPDSLGDTNNQRSQGRGEPIGPSSDQWPAWPPGPSDSDAWARVLAERPDLAPTVDGRLSPAFVEWLQGFPILWTAPEPICIMDTRHIQGGQDADAHEAHPSQILPGVQRSNAAEGQPWSYRGPGGIRQEEILQPGLHGTGDGQGTGDGRRLSQAAYGNSEGHNLCGLWVKNQPSSSSPEWRYIRQLPDQLGDIVCLLSYQGALGRKGENTQAAQALHHLRVTFSEVMARDVPDALPALEEAWQSLSADEKGRVFMGAYRRVFATAARVQRLAALGDAVVWRQARLAWDILSS